MDWAWFLVLVGMGLLAGTWGVLIGAGGGFVMVPLLLLFRGTLSAAEVTAVSLVAVFVSAVSGTGAYARLGRIDYKSGLRFLLATLPGGIGGALLVNRIEKGPFQVLFGVLLILVASYIFARPRRQVRATASSSGSPRRMVDHQGSVYEYRVNVRLGMAVNLMEGFLASIFGIGGGIFNVPFFVLILGIPIQVATATSQFMITGTSLVASVTNILQGDLHGLWITALALATGTLVGGQLGARVSQRISAAWLARVLAAGLLVAGGRLTYGGITSL